MTREPAGAVTPGSTVGGTRGHRPVRGAGRPAAARRTARADRRRGQAGRRPAPRGAGRDRRGDPRGPAGAGLRGHRHPGAERRGGQDRRGRRVLLEGARPDRLHPQRRHRRRRRRRHHRPRRASSPRPGCAGCAGSPCRRPCWAWWTRRSAARPASTPPRARTSSAPSTRPPGCCATWPPWTRCRSHDYVSGLAEIIKAGFIADPVDPGADRGRPGGARAAPAGRTPPS